MNNREVDITYTVKASEAAGRRLIKNLDTGKTRWVGGEAPALPTQPEEVEQAMSAEQIANFKPPTKAELKKLEAQLKALNKTYQD